MNRLRLSKTEAVGAFVNLSMDDVWRYCAAIIGAGRADDAVQETFIRAMKSLTRFCGEASARTWLLKIARLVCIDDMRARTPQSESSIGSPRSPSTTRHSPTATLPS